MVFFLCYGRKLAPLQHIEAPKLSICKTPSHRNTITTRTQNLQEVHKTCTFGAQNTHQRRFFGSTLKKLTPRQHIVAPIKLGFPKRLHIALLRSPHSHKTAKKVDKTGTFGAQNAPKVMFSGLGKEVGTWATQWDTRIGCLGSETGAEEREERVKRVCTRVKGVVQEQSRQAMGAAKAAVVRTWGLAGLME